MAKKTKQEAQREQLSRAEKRNRQERRTKSSRKEREKEKRRKKQEREEVEMESAADKYKESSEQTVHAFEEAVVKDTVLTDDDNCTVRFMKKICEFNTAFYPLFMGLVLSFVIWKGYAFEFTVYLIGLVCCMCFNVFKVHRACIDFVLSRWTL